MTFEQLLNLAMYRLKVRTDAGTRAGCLLEMQMAQSVYERSAQPPWFLLGTDTSVSTTAGVEFVTLPITFLNFEEDGILEPVRYYDPTVERYIPVRRKPQSQLTDSDAWEIDTGITEGTPLVFDALATTLVFRPIPDDVYLLKIQGYFSDTAPTDSSATNLWATYAPDLLLAEIIYNVATKHLGDNEIGAAAATEVARASKRIKDETTAKQQSGLLLAMGEES